MGQKTCEKCGESVEEAKAFCPACGDAFVEEEQRKDESAFAKMDSTVQIGKTMYGQMLTDMGLNISKAADAAPQPEKRVAVVAPIATSAVKVTPPQVDAAPSAKRNYLVWIIVGVAALIVGLAVLVVIAAAVFVYLNRLT